MDGSRRPRPRLSNKRHIETVQHSSKKSDWRTPPPLFAKLDTEFEFTVDVAAHAQNRLLFALPTEVRPWFGPGGFCEDGLAADWSAHTCFMNPPYSKEEKLRIDPWIEKAWSESQRGATVVGVLPFNPQTAWYRHYVYGHELKHAAMEVRQLSHRVTFNYPDGTPADNAPGNTCIVIWKPNPGYIDLWQPVVRYWSYRVAA